MVQASFIETLGIIDLISEKHKQLRSETMMRITERLESRFSEMDIYLLSLTQHMSLSLSETARYMNISRQAAHKHAQNLLALGYIEVMPSELNRRDKVVVLTQAGKNIVEKINVIKSEIESELEEEIGSENYTKIMALFRSQWRLNSELK